MSAGELESSKRKRPAARAVVGTSGAGKSAVATPAVKASGRAAPAKAAKQAESADGAAQRVSARAVAAEAPRRAAKPRVSSARATAARKEAEQAPVETQASGSALDADTSPAGVHDMERDLAGLLHDVEGADGDAEARRRAADAIGRIAARLHPSAPAEAAPDESLLGGARQLLSADYYLRLLSQRALRGRAEQVDDFGLDAVYEARVQPLLDVLYERYFRVQLEGAEHLPERGAALLVCNHSGTLPWDGVMLKTALRHARGEGRGLRWLTDDFVFHAPFLGPWLNRIGAVRACPENAERLLERGELLAVFPEGVKGIGKPYRERYRLERFGRGGHVKLALRTGVPLIPLAIVGAEETYPLLYKVRAFSKLLGVPFIPVTPLFPWLGPLGLVPLPSRWQIMVGEPMTELNGLGARAADDSVLVNELNGQLRSKVQALVDQALQARGSAFF
jgi:1-acyl-sn-glycerol-3-phosphate acyltransferase